jgi:hypothetical protein
MPQLLQKLGAAARTLEEIHSAWSAVPIACGVLNGLVFRAIPITPLLRVLAVLLLIVFCAFAVLWALSRSRGVAPADAVGNSKLRHLSIALLIFGTVFLVGYFPFVTHFNEAPLTNQVIDSIIDAAQAVLFAIPWALWTGAFVLIAPRK